MSTWWWANKPVKHEGLSTGWWSFTCFMLWAAGDPSPDLASKLSCVDADTRRLFTARLSLVVVMLRDNRLTDGIILSSSPRLLAPALDVSSCPRLDRMSSFSSLAAGAELTSLADFLLCFALPASPVLSLQMQWHNPVNSYTKEYY